jgi:hypothetical protein
MSVCSVAPHPSQVKKEDPHSSTGVVHNYKGSKVVKPSPSSFRNAIERRNRFVGACYDYRLEVQGAVALGKKIGQCFQGISVRDSVPNPWYRNCKDKSCSYCRQAKQNITRRELEAILKSRVKAGALISFVTLTQRGFKNESPTSARRRIMRTWARTMRSTYLRRSIGGYFRNLEVTKKGDFYHFHLHALVEIKKGSHTKFKRMLEKYWRGAGGGFSKIMRVDKRMRSSTKRLKNMTFELTRYVTKSDTSLTRKDWVSVACAVRGKRDFGFGMLWASLRKVVSAIRKKEKKEVSDIPDAPNPFNQATGEVAYLPDGIYRVRTLFGLADKGVWSAEWGISLVKWALRWSNHPLFAQKLDAMNLSLNLLKGAEC